MSAAAFPLLTINRHASGAIEPYRILAATATDGVLAQSTGPSSDHIAVSSNLSAADGERLDVEIAGIAPVQYGAVVAPGDPLTSDGDGKAVPATDADRVIGIAIEEGELDEIGSVLLLPGSQSPGGSYAPTLTGVANVDSATLVAARWTRSGPVVRVDMELDVDPTAGATATQVRATLPVASALAAATDVSGQATLEGGGAAGTVQGDAVNDAALLDFTSSGTAAERWKASFSYLVA